MQNVRSRASSKTIIFLRLREQLEHCCYTIHCEVASQAPTLSLMAVVRYSILFYFCHCGSPGSTWFPLRRGLYSPFFTGGAGIANMAEANLFMFLVRFFCLVRFSSQKKSLLFQHPARAARSRSPCVFMPSRHTCLASGLPPSGDLPRRDCHTVTLAGKV